MTDVNPYRYTIKVQEIEEDGDRVFEATISELPDAADYAETHSEAYKLAIQTIEAAAEMYAESGRDFPIPRKREDEFSGRVTLRMPKSTHAKAFRMAENENVSLNQFIVATIAEKVGGTTAWNHVKNYLDSHFEKTNKNEILVHADVNFDEPVANSAGGAPVLRLIK